jgi:oxygen-dependent protoporphyrinogen oxidase
VTEQPSRSVAVVGGGISGLIAARELQSQGVRVHLYEAGARVGGKIRTGELRDAPVEEGPDSFLARDPVAVRLCYDLGLSDDLVAPAIFGAHILLEDRLVKLPQGLPYGIPISPWSAYRSGALSLTGAFRAAAEPVMGRRLRGRDVSVATFIRKRFGREALDRLVDPLLAGTRAGATGKMSLAAALPAADEAARNSRSVMLALRRARKASGETGAPPFLGLRGGMTRMIDALHEGLDSVTAGTTVESVRQEAGVGYELILSGTEKVHADGVVLAVPAYSAAPLLQELVPQASRLLERIEYASVAVVSLVYPADALPIPADASGLLVPISAGRTISAVTWFSQKWPHTRPPDGAQIVRAFVGRAGRTRALDLTDAELAGRAATELSDILASDAFPDDVRVSRWERSLPQYQVGHLRRVEEIERSLERHPRVAVTGAGYRGSGIPDCIRSARAAAHTVARALGLSPEPQDSA